jgi:hypothetical protein
MLGPGVSHHDRRQVRMAARGRGCPVADRLRTLRSYTTTKLRQRPLLGEIRVSGRVSAPIYLIHPWEVREWNGPFFRSGVARCPALRIAF